MANNVGYMISPLILTERQILIYQKLYEKCNFVDMTVKYTLSQIRGDIKIVDIPEMTIYKDINKMIKSGFLEVLEKARKGNPPLYKVVNFQEISGKPKVNQEKAKGKLKHSNNEGLRENEENQKKTIVKPKVNPIKEKEKEYINIYSHWNSKKIIVHKSITKDIEKAIEKALKNYSENDIVQAIDTYSEILESEFYFNYRWSLVNFLNRKNGISAFMEEGSNKANYESWKKEREHNANTNKFTKRDRGVFNKDSENIRIELPEREFKHYTNEELTALGID